MKKKNLRLLALGFFLSGLLVAGVRVVEGETSTTPNNEQEVEELEQEIASLEEELARLEVAQATDEQDEEEPEEVEEPEEEEENSDDEADSESEDETEENNEEDDEEEPEEEEEVLTTTVTLEEGQPSSVATQQLENAGIIEDRLEFDLFLDDNDYAVLVRPGSYEVNSDMSFEELAAALRGQ